MVERVGISDVLVHRYAATALTVMSAVPLWYLGGAVSGLIVLVVAVFSLFSTRRLSEQIRKADEQKAALDRQLLQSQKLASIGELSSGIAHEINNPLAVIGQEVEWMKHILGAEGIQQGEGIEDLADSLREIARQVERCGQITHKLLDFARKREPLIQGVDLNKLVEDMAKLVEKEASLNHIRIIRDYQSDLPVVQTDAPLVRQVILNLLNNARQAVGKDGTVTISSRMCDDHCVALTVRDTGCGIPPENRGKIFDPFFTTKPPGEGTGLGLSLCHGIINRLGGTISVESETGKGAAFTIVLPVQKSK